MFFFVLVKQPKIICQIFKIVIYRVWNIAVGKGLSINDVTTDLTFKSLPVKVTSQILPYLPGLNLKNLEMAWYKDTYI